MVSVSQMSEGLLIFNHVYALTILIHELKEMFSVALAVHFGVIIRVFSASKPTKWHEWGP
jgi:hypothetical protein